MTEVALAKLMEQPASKYTPDSYGQLLPFITKLSAEEAKQLKDYLSQNASLKNTIERGEQLKSIIVKK